MGARVQFRVKNFKRSGQAKGATRSEDQALSKGGRREGQDLGWGGSTNRHWGWVQAGHRWTKQTRRSKGHRWVIVCNRMGPGRQVTSGVDESTWECLLLPACGRLSCQPTCFPRGWGHCPSTKKQGKSVMLPDEFSKANVMVHLKIPLGPNYLSFSHFGGSQNTWYTWNLICGHQQLSDTVP